MVLSLQTKPLPQTINIEPTHGSDVDFAVGNGRYREFHGASCSIAPPLGGVEEFFAEVGRVVSVQNGSPGGVHRTALDDPEDRIGVCVR